MDIEPVPAILAAVEGGRAGRGWPRYRAGHWSRLHAVVLTLLAEGWSRAVVGEELGVSASRINNLRAEACDAVLRSAARSAEADAVCARMWRAWCSRGDAEACVRL